MFGEPRLLSLSVDTVYLGATKAAFASQVCFALAGTERSSCTDSFRQHMVLVVLFFQMP